MSDHPFIATSSGELHAGRRGPILEQHPTIPHLYGYDRRTMWITILVVGAQLFLAWAFGHAARTGHWVGRWWVVVPWSYLCGAVLTHWLSMAIHETSHDLACRTRAGNKALAVFANIPMVFPCAMSFHRYHPRHHALLGVYPDDTDLPDRREVACVGGSPVGKFLWVFFYSIVYLVRETLAARKPRRDEVANGLLMVAVNAAIVHWWGWSGFGYLCLCTFFGHGLHPVATHFVHEHFTFADGQETYSYYGVLNHVTFNVGYHNEHHDFPRIPGWRLPELKRIAPEAYDGLVSHRSWSGVITQFIVDARMTLGRRIVRSRTDYRRHTVRGASRGHLASPAST
jgi:sphingolipid delta-4 desaturase